MVVVVCGEAVGVGVGGQLRGGAENKMGGGDERSGGREGWRESREGGREEGGK